VSETKRHLIIAEVSKIDTSIGQRARIVYVDPTTLIRGSRLADELFADVLKPGEKVEGKILKAKVKSYSFTDSISGDTINADVAPIVQLGDETLEQAVRANGKQMPPLSLSSFATGNTAEANTAETESTEGTEAAVEAYAEEQATPTMD